MPVCSDKLQGRVSVGPHKRMGSFYFGAITLMDATGCISRQPRNPQRGWRDSHMPIYNQAAGHLDPLAIQVFVCPSEMKFLNCIERPPVSTTTGESLNKTLSSSRFCHPRKTVFPARSRA